jgi:hypothetical protein
MRFLEQKKYFICFAAFAWAAILYVLLKDLVPGKVFFTQDLATSFGVAREFLEGQSLLLGPPSHVGGRHLGPHYYWAVAFGLIVGQGDTYKAIYALVILNLSSLFILIFILTKFFRGLSLYGAVIGLVCTVLGSKFLWVLRDPWHANLVLLFSSVFLLSFYKTLERGKWYFLLMIFAGGVLGQMHFSGAPLIIGLGLVAVVSLKKLPQRDSVSKQEKMICIGAGVLTLLSFLPLLVYELRYESILSPLLKGLGDRADVVVEYLSLFAHLGRFFGDYTPFHAVNLPVVFHHRVLKVLFFISGSVLGISWFLQSSHRKRYFAAGILVAILFYIFSLRHTPDLYNYYLNALLPVVIIAASIGFGYAVKCLSQISSKKTIGVSALVFSILFLLFSFENYRKTSKQLSERPVAHWHSLATSIALAQAISSDNQAGAEFELVTQGESDISREAIFYELGSRHFDEFHYREVFEEIKRKAPRTEAPEIGYGVFFPRNDWLKRRAARRHRSDEWIDEQDISLTGCVTCRNCDLIRLKRKPKQ